ncbi:cation diffusion facilitator family transporter [Chloroflexota bacterium]
MTPPTPPSKNTISNSQQIKRVLWQVLGVNLLVAIAKIVVGTVTGSISMMADGFHSTMDGSSNVIGLVGMAIAERPPDEDHPYGHQKYEAFATLAIGLLLLLTTWNVLKSTITRLIEGGTPEVTIISFAVMFITIGLNWAVSRYESKQGHRLKSSILLADAAHTRSDIFVSLSVIVGLGAVKLGWLWVDAAVALIIVVVIGKVGWEIIRRASNVLADSAVVDVAEVERIALSVEGVKSCHKIRSRGTDHATYLDLHIQVDSQMSLAIAHYLGHQVQDHLQEELELTDVVVHVEPAEFS